MFFHVDTVFAVWISLFIVHVHAQTPTLQLPQGLLLSVRILIAEHLVHQPWFESRKLSGFAALAVFDFSCALTNRGEPGWCPMHAQWTQSLVPCGLCNSDDPFSFVDCGYRVERAVVFICFNFYLNEASGQHVTFSFVATTKEDEWRGCESLYLTFLVNKKKEKGMFVFTAVTF